jgi:hypothetical protein
MFKLFDRVMLKTFNGCLSGYGKKNDNYYRLIGEKGTILQSPSEKSIFASFSDEKKVLVRFDVDVLDLGLSCHNEVKNSLWILVNDLMKI